MLKGIENAEQIDLITHDPVRDEYVLIMSAAQDWDSDHVVALRKKIQSYLRFVKSGQLISRHPEMRNKPIRFQLDTYHDLSAEADRLIEAAERAWLEQLDIAFRVERIEP